MDVSQYLEIFIDESSEHIQTLSDCIMALEQEPDNKDTINEVFREGTGEVCEGLPSQIPGCAHCGTQRAGGQSLPQFRCTEMAERNRY